MKRAKLRAVCGVLAVLCASIAVSPQVDGLCDRFFAWHMAQHVVLMFVVPLFAVLADPFRVVRKVAGKRNIVRLLQITKPLRVLASPPAALVVLIAVLWWTHFSPLYEASLDNKGMHLFEHALFFAAGAWFWLPVIAPPPVRPVSYPARLVYIFLAMPQGALLAAAIASAHLPLYAHYAAALSPDAALADQSNAAAVMWICGGLLMFATLLGTAGAWARREREA